ncbi:hypothetical protein [Streptococcus sp. S784/96/1]|uniref:hypothetical protein n=1 Tax=Streptococcus sp. S784/96/1 TaxID=2653499 RepID=UPI00138A6C08|nr:hypothetical protein [Streptococcus sp. S784/96/1]
MKQYKKRLSQIKETLSSNTRTIQENRESYFEFIQSVIDSPSIRAIPSFNKFVQSRLKGYD